MLHIYDNTQTRWGMVEICTLGNTISNFLYMATMLIYSMTRVRNHAIEFMHMHGEVFVINRTISRWLATH